MEDFISRWTSRKFLMGAGAFVALILSTAGVMDDANSTKLVEAVVAVASVVSIGLVDAVKALKK